MTDHYPPDTFTIHRKGKRLNVPVSTHDSISPSEMLCVEQIVNDLHQHLAQDTLDAIKSEKAENLIMYHHTFGRWIRNQFCLWAPNNPNVIPNDSGDGHPDGISNICLNKLHSLLNNNQENRFDDAMTVINDKTKKQ